MKLNKSSIFDSHGPMVTTSLLNGKVSGVLNWNNIAYPQMYDLYNVLLSNFWKAQEINMQDDIKQWETLSEKEKSTFLQINAQLAALDSIQTPVMYHVLEYVTDPSFKAIFAIISQQEAVHNESYSYILSSLIPLQEQHKWFENAKNDPLVNKRNAFIMEGYNAFLQEPTVENILKLAVYSIVLEGIYFYSGFAFFYHLSRKQKMVKTSTMISYIQRDELQHAYFMSQFVRIVRKENAELITPEVDEWIKNTIMRGVELEKEWSTYILFSVEGIEMDEFHAYLEYLGNKRLRQLDLPNAYKDNSNPMPWIQVYDDQKINETKSDFFEQKSRSYAKVSSLNGFDEL
nr:ribonucleotide-diphosphate reductase subunit beta [Mangrovibacillus cuniculi]